ncbi:MAG: Mur ligase family protein [Rhodocyclaceae bacterium]|nr:Mur ligase family protein [Rhodocyclaceae bacterium]
MTRTFATINTSLNGIDLAMTSSGVRFVLEGVSFDAPVLGRFNVSNLLAVIGVLRVAGETLENIAEALRHLTPPSGRLQMLTGVNAPLFVVDYAHTPDALENVLSTLRETATARGGKLICVFGCGGDRDAGKRPLMGEVAERWADRVIVTSDNPRSENPAAILDAIVSGMKHPPMSVEPDRAMALRKAAMTAQANDVILIAGKGHESYQEIDGIRHPFSDLDCARAIAAIFCVVGSDSRHITPGMLFVALKGEHFDGHDYVLNALEQGAGGAMVSNAFATAHQGLPLIAVEDTLIGLGQLAADWRNRFEIPVIGITGSNGKTTVKEMCAAILRAHFGDDTVLATEGNLNNEIGLPMTLLKLRPHHRVAVVEMGMNHPGEISRLSRMARPTVVIINNAQRAHLEGLGGLEAVARAKGEIFEGLTTDGIAILNAEDSHVDLWIDMAGDKKVIPFDLLTHDLPTLALPGRHNRMNAQAAVNACLSIGVPHAEAIAVIANFTGITGRLQRRAGMNKSVILDDTYNANPDSMRAALDVLCEEPGRRLFVMGDMGETGDQAGQFHDEIGGYAKSQGVDLMFALGELSAVAVANFGTGATHFQRSSELSNALKKSLKPGDTILVKGSRFMRMERIVEAITEEHIPHPLPNPPLEGEGVKLLPFQGGGWEGDGVGRCPKFHDAGCRFAMKVTEEHSHAS